MKHHHRHDNSSCLLRRSCQPPQGFSLVEILVVIAIIAILVGISVPAFMSRQGPASATRVTLDALKGAATEFEVETGKPAVSLNSGIYANPVYTNYSGTQYLDPNPPAPQSPPAKAKIGDSVSDAATNFENYSISRFVHQLMIYPTTNKMLRSLGPEVFLDSDGDNFADVVDGWGNKIVYYNPADDFNTTSNQNNTQAQLFPISRTPYFASAGEDGEWGDYRDLIKYRKNPSSLSASETTLANEAMDNLYSFDQGH
jgi:prepilin-type N-terminal cleavage/methylation domain-containing protein